MRNLLLVLRFNGSNYHGYQVQRNAPAVANVFQQALWQLLGHRADLKGCSRTDTGVHANMFCVSFFTSNPLPCDGLVKGLNNMLPPDIAVVYCTEVPVDFHARYSGVGKRYLYKIRNSDIKDPFSQQLVYDYRHPRLDELLMDSAAKGFIGRHDFSAFCSAGGGQVDPVREITAFDVWRRGDMVYCAVTGNGFLYNMVRIMVGTLIDVGTGRTAVCDIPGIIASRDRTAAGPTAPACGLYLDAVFYPAQLGLPDAFTADINTHSDMLLEGTPWASRQT